MLPRSLRALTAAGVVASASLLAPVASARAQSFATRVEEGTTHRYEIRTSFGPTMHQPSQGDFRTVGDLALETTVFANSVDDGRIVLVVRIDALRLHFIDDDGSRITGLRFDSADPEETDDANLAGSLRQAVGETFEVLIEEGGEVTALRDTFTNFLPDDNAGRIVARLVSGGMLETSIRWIFDLPPRDLAAEAGASFSDTVVVRFTGDGRVEFEPRFTVGAVEDGAADLEITGDVVYVDDRTPKAVLEGREPFTIDEASVEGAARWDLGLGALRSLDLTTYARVEPQRIDPLGRRIERRSIEQIFTIRRLDAEAAAAR
jgi:hypothetical protein